MNFSLHFSYNFLTCPRVNYRNQYKHLNNDLSSSSKCFGFTRFPSWAIVYISADRPQISDVNSINISSRDPLWKKAVSQILTMALMSLRKAAQQRQFPRRRMMKGCGTVVKCLPRTIGHLVYLSVFRLLKAVWESKRRTLNSNPTSCSTHWRKDRFSVCQRNAFNCTAATSCRQKKGSSKGFILGGWKKKKICTHMLWMYRTGASNDSLLAIDRWQASEGFSFGLIITVRERRSSGGGFWWKAKFSGCVSLFSFVCLCVRVKKKRWNSSEKKPTGITAFN